MKLDFRSDNIDETVCRDERGNEGCSVGDDVYGEDPTVNHLEEIAAKILGKEAALLVTSGTQGNQVAILTHCRPGEE